MIYILAYYYIKFYYNLYQSICEKKANNFTSCHFLYRYLHVNSITHITSTDYCRLTSLTELYLTGNELTEDNMDVDSFTCVTTLATL